MLQFSKFKSQELIEILQMTFLLKIVLHNYTFFEGGSFFLFVLLTQILKRKNYSVITQNLKFHIDSFSLKNKWKLL